MKKHSKVAEDIGTQHHYVAIQSKKAFTGTRFSVNKGELRVFRYLNKAPRVVCQARDGLDMEWGGAVISHSDYAVIFDGKGWANYKNAMELRT